jgi:hypothetical protein
MLLFHQVANELVKKLLVVTMLVFHQVATRLSLTTCQQDMFATGLQQAVILSSRYKVDIHNLLTNC